MDEALRGKAHPRDEWNRHRIQEVLQPCAPDNTVTPDSDAVKALSKMNNSGLTVSWLPREVVWLG